MISKELLRTDTYDFLRKDVHLGRYIMFLGLSGSYGYGTNGENSDVDIRGAALNRKSDLIGFTSFEQFEDRGTDTCIYGFNKLISLLVGCNPNTIELLGLKGEHYLYMSSLGKELLEQKKLFLSKRAIQSFGGYADAQLRRLQNALARDSCLQKEKEQHILNSIHNGMHVFQARYERFEEGSIRLYLDHSARAELEEEIYADISLSHYPLRDYRGIWAEMNSIIKDYNKLGKRNKKKDDNHLNKHAMHLIRLFFMGIDILEQGEINTFRDREQGLLLDIRGGAYQKADGSFRPEFYELLNECEGRLKYAAVHTCLPDEPDMKRIGDYVMSVNERVVRDEI